MKGVKYTAKEKERALKMWLEEGKHWQFVCKKNKCTRVSLWRWKTQYDGTLASLDNKSSCSHTPHPTQQTEQEKKDIMQILADNPTMGYTALWGELRAKCAYSRHYLTMYKYIRKHCLRPAEIYEKYIPKNYETPMMLGVKWQMDVKFVPKECMAGEVKKNLEEIGEKHYQYTIIDEATRERFIFAYREHSSWSTKDFIQRAVLYFGYAPAIIQTDNGLEFRNPAHAKPETPHAAIDTMKKLGIQHHLIRPYTPRHNGKVERSHRTDQERFYNFLTYSTFAELQEKMAAWLTQYNKTPSTALRDRHGKKRMQSPLDKRAELLEILAEQGGVTKITDHDTQKEVSIKIRFLKNHAA